MAHYYYPAIFSKEKNGSYSVVFPDIEGCYTGGDDLNDAMEMARDALALMLVELEDSKEMIPKPTDMLNILTDHNAFSTIIECDTDLYRRTVKNKAVKKTLTIPEWLNDMAIAAGINFSQTLQDALMKKLNL